jgi:hypothetical protein
MSHTETESNNIKFNTIYLCKSLENTLSFIQSENATKDVDFLITVQSFVQNILANLVNYLDQSKFEYNFY